MSIYSTIWILKFPEYGDSHSQCGWVSVLAQGVGSHIGNMSCDADYIYASFLPPSVPEDIDEFRAVVFVTEHTAKGTESSPQEYDSPLLVLSGQEYSQMSLSLIHI